MARNEEKSHSMLNKWLEMKKEELHGVARTRRPTTASEVHSVSECEKWRGHLLKDIGRKITQIQNSSLTERRIRELNDEINKLLREKSRWERRILELGGPNHFTSARDDDDDLAGGVSVGGGRGEYKYFGEAKNLPEVKALLKKKAEQKNEKEKEKDGRKAHELHRGLDADYYGFRDDDDGVLEKVEAAAEKAAMEAAVREWSAAHSGQAPESLDDNDRQLVHVETLQSAPLAPTVAVPSREEIEARLLERRKEELLRKYQSSQLLVSLLESQAEAKAAMET